MTATPRRDQRSEEAQSWRALYSGKRWRSLREIKLRSSPLCVYCQQDGKITPANVVDHIEPHKGDMAKFWDYDNLQSLCKQHHDGRKQSEERRGYSTRVSHDGWPEDPRHPANGGTPAAVVGNAMTHPSWFRPVYIPLTIVCGPPGSGKSTYVAQHAGANDLVICFDRIACEMFSGAKGNRAHATLAGDQIGDVLRRRNEMLGDLMRAAAKTRWPAAWLIVSEPKRANRQWWQDKLSSDAIVVMATPPDVCMKRIRTDAEDGDRRFRGAGSVVDKWWRVYEPRDGDIVVHP